MEPFIRMFVTSRPNIDLQAKFTNVCRVDICASDSDIDAYLRSEIDTNNRLSKIIAGHPKLGEEIRRIVNEKAAGM